MDYFLNDRELTKYLGLTFYLSGEYEDALTEFLKVREMEIEHIKNYPDHKHGDEFVMSLNSIIALVQLKLKNVDNAKKEYHIVKNWFEKQETLEFKDEEVYHYYIHYSLFRLHQYFGNHEDAKIVLEKAYNSTSKRLKREYQMFKELGGNNKYELLKYFWVKDIIDNYQQHFKD